MTGNVTVVDYGCGNLLSVSRGLEEAGGTVNVTDDADKIANAERLLLPGVGAFGKAMQAMRDGGLEAPIKAFAQTGRPFLGICVGMQAMLDYSEEFGRHEGLGLISGHVAAIPATAADGTPHPIPHIGWNRLKKPATGWDGSILEGRNEGAFVYFVHSFAATPEDKQHILATCDYNGRTVTAAIAKDNMTGCQFHPEKSGPAGLKILENFIQDQANMSP